MNTTDNTNTLHNHVRPYRNIPFDIGCHLGDRDVKLIQDTFFQHGLTKLAIPDFLQTLSKYILFLFEVNTDIRLFVFSFGIGVFTMRDKDYSIQSPKYAAEYCENRKIAHHDILKGEHGHSEKLYALIDWLRRCVRENNKHIRDTATPDWEYNGLSYVMTVSAVQLANESHFAFSDLDRIEQTNLLIMLEPGIVHQEDSMLLELETNTEDFDPYSSEELLKQNPRNWMKSNDTGLYISWAASSFVL